ncbi:hypothetical protein [Aureispira anguillae]|uniref:Uncharacterized protein n=1 Tax=Aureispira anguillae TaxID=2864201 RepID=A0A915YDL3_9BACT|nr:hypothetical protein [Aureispira anguillae]BDS11119.1 hypothetical protein AsAng_0018300 [Aureispira anguillae]
MKQILYIFLLLSFYSTLLAQSINSDFEVKNIQLDEDIYALDHGTRGLLLVFEYKYSTPLKRLATVVPRVTLKKNGMGIYLDEKTILVLETNKWAKAQIFLPYRNINLLKGKHEEIELNLFAPKLLNYTTTFNYDQPLRYEVEMYLKDGSVKKQLSQYDKSSNPKEWLPDPYYIFTTNGGTEPLFQSKVVSNSYKFKPQKIQFYILEGEQLAWSFYDRDGGEDLKLGTYTKINPRGEYIDNVYGQMFGNIRNLEFTYAQRAQSHQAISIYSDPDYLHNGKKGVAITIEYDLAKAYVGKKAQIHLDCYTQNGVKLKQPILHPIEETPEMGSWMDLEVKGQLKYFIPFYAWENRCRDIEFYFELGNKQQVNAARHTLHSPIEFDEWVIDAGVDVAENFVFQGARGVRLGFHYELFNNHGNAPLHVNFYQEDGSKVPFSVYNIIGNELAVDVQGKHITNNPRLADHLYYFIPYANLNNEVIVVQADLVPDIAMNIIRKKTQPLSRILPKDDIFLDLVAAEGRFRADNYGQVLEMKLEVPKFFLDKTKFELDVRKNGRHSTAFLMGGILKSSDKDYILREDSGRVYIVFPHRNIVAGTRFSLVAFVSNIADNKGMSDTIRWEWKAPKDLFNRKVEVALTACKFSKRIMQDTLLDRAFPWSYIVEAGGETLVQEPLTKRMGSKKMKEQFRQEVLVNREDNIVVKLLNTKNKHTVVLWKGDLGKWEQNAFKAELANKYPAKMIRVLAKVDKDYKKNSDNGML